MECQGRKLAVSTPEIVDGALAREYLRRAIRKASGGEDFLLQHALADVSERLATIARDFPVAALIAPAVPQEAGQLQAGGKIMDLRLIEASNNSGGVPGLGAGNYDLVISLLGLQGENDVPGAMVQMTVTTDEAGANVVQVPVLPNTGYYSDLTAAS